MMAADAVPQNIMKSPISRREFVALTGGVGGAALTRATSRHDSRRDPMSRFEVLMSCDACTWIQHR